MHARLTNVESDVALVSAAPGGDELTWSFTMHGPTEFPMRSTSIWPRRRATRGS